MVYSQFQYKACSIAMFILMKIQAELLSAYRKVASKHINTSRLEAHLRFYKLLMKGKFDVYFMQKGKVDFLILISSKVVTSINAHDFMHS